MPKIALTFDDGPSEWTEPILDELARHDAGATFFLVGSEAERRPEIVRRIAAEGHEIGNHTWSHPHLARDCDDGRVLAELGRTSDTLAEISGSRPRRFRAPYHDADDRVRALARKLGLTHTPSTVRPPDWHAGSRTAVIVTMVLQLAGPGAVVGLHDGLPLEERVAGAGREGTVQAVETLVPILYERGFECVTASALLETPSA
jgi:peptidoglycan/xylan/chitin deacetylase (PgdA/CDA1 family)